MAKRKKQQRTRYTVEQRSKIIAAAKSESLTAKDIRKRFGAGYLLFMVQEDRCREASRTPLRRKRRWERLARWAGAWRGPSPHAHAAPSAGASGSQPVSG